MLKAVKINFEAFGYVSDSLLEEEAEFISKVTKNEAFMLWLIEMDYQNAEYADEDLLKQEAFWLEAIEVDFRAIQYAHKDLLKDKKFIHKAMEIDLRTLKYTSPSLEIGQ